MKGYWTGSSYFGWIPNKNGGGEYKKFYNDAEYREIYEYTVGL